MHQGRSAAPHTAPLRVVLGNGSLGMQNYGDVAMLKVAINRFRHLWPDAIIQVVTDRPDRLKYHCPEAQPISVSGNLVGKFCQRGRFPGPLLQRSPPGSLLLFKLNQALQRKAPFAGSDLEAAIQQADLVVAAGGGYMNDLFSYYAYIVLEMLDAAHLRQIPTAIVGQGLGPMSLEAFKQRCRHTLPKLDMLAVREARVGPPLLRSLGVSSEKVIVTGDDAIELAYQARKPDLGDGIGVNLRVTAYSMADENTLVQVRQVLDRSARKFQAPLIPTPISMSKGERDWKNISDLIAGTGVRSDGGRSLKTPEALIEQVGRCRVVVTGSYHAAVFALAQGIPAVCLAKSQYYFEKFEGLVEQFGEGGIIVSMDKNLDTCLPEAIDAAWHSAEKVRSPLLTAAKRQIQCSWTGYENLQRLVENNLRSPRLSKGA